MRTATLSTCALRAAALAAIFVVPGSALAQPYKVPCNKGGDQLGFSIATNGDFNGDGVNDIAIGAPCTYVQTFPHAGRVIVVDGKNGRKLFTKKGGQDGQWYGAAVSFLRDLNGDGRDELAIGSPGYDVTAFDQGDPLARTKESAGRVDVYQRRKRRMRVLGTNPNSGFGEKIAPLNDTNGDKKADFVVSASTDSKPDGRSQPGRVWLVSGKNGDLLSYRVGPKAGGNYGRSLAAADDLDGDGFLDFLAGSNDINVPNVFHAGMIEVASTADIQGESLFDVVGARGDGMGKSLDYAGDVNGDGIADFIAGSDRADDVAVKQAGLVTLFSVDGRRLWVKEDKDIQEKANFGDAVATIGDINGDGVTDFAAAAAQHDVFVAKKQHENAGRVVTMSGVNGEEIWSIDGNRREEEFGFALDGEIDFNLDEVPDVVVGTIGDDPFGRRGAGSVRILSGVDGSPLFSVAGRRGLETRIVTAVPASLSESRLRSFNRRGRRLEMDTVALKGVFQGELSVTVLNDRNIPRPKACQAAITSGYGSNKSMVEVYRLGRREKLVDKFEAFPGENFGVECAGGELNGEINEDLVCTQASSPDGNVLARVFRRLDEEDPFFVIDEFPVFSETDQYSEFFPIDASGANVSVGDVTGSAEEEIVVGTNRGVPMVRIFNREGVLIREFLAYDPIIFSGVDVSVIDLDGAGDLEIVTVPREGQALVKVFNGNTGERVYWGRDDKLISILARPESYVGGARVGAADVDLDDQQEILVMIPSPAGGHEVLAFEPDNKSARRFNEFNPWPGGRVGGAIAGTDRFVRN